MEIKTILVHLDPSEYSSPRVDAAILLAAKYRASLRGVYTSSPGQGAVESRAEAEFFKKTSLAGLEGEWTLIDPGLTPAGSIEALIYEAHFADLIIAGQPGPASSRLCPPKLVEHLLLSSGRPVLIIPYAGAFPTLGDRILVAWMPGAKSTRALNDALPLLKTAQHVCLFSVNSQVTAEEQEPKKIGSFLLRHGIAAKTGEVPLSEIGVGNILLNLVTDEGIDLLVTGSHIQMRGARLDPGPVGEYLLKHMTAPVLMSQ